jgi:DNA-binding NtrC family response regulator
MLDRVDPAVIVSDQRMPGMPGIELLRRAKQQRPDALGILLTAYADLAVLIDAVNSGAVDRYLQKPWDSKELTVILRQAIDTFATVRENRRLREQLAHYTGYLEHEQRDAIDFGELVGESAAMRELGARIEIGARSSSPVLIEGERGSEKEVVARAIHVASPREEKPFVKVACGVFRGDGLERELFGWKRGSFDGAFDDRGGRFQLADGGTIFLDELAPLPPSLQARLLRLLTDGEVERIGAVESTRVNVRIVVSLTPSLAEAWASSDVHPDLVSRLSVFPVRLAPLRERSSDIRLLAEHFLRKYARKNPHAPALLSSHALSKLESYSWPGNVRELENVIERAAILSRDDVIHAEHLAFAPAVLLPAHSDPDLGTPTPDIPRLAQPMSAAGPTHTPTKVHLDSQLDDIERHELLTALKRCGGNKAEVARSLGIQRTTLYYRLKRLGIEA